MEKAVTSRGVLSHGKSLYGIAVNHIASSLDSEKTWHSYMSVIQPPTPDRARYVRINPQLSEDPPRLDEVGRLAYIQEKVRDMLLSENKIQRVALRLIASSFYFEKSNATELKEDGSVLCKGTHHSPSLFSILTTRYRTNTLPIASGHERTQRAGQASKGEAAELQGPIFYHSRRTSGATS